MGLRLSVTAFAWFALVVVPFCSSHATGLKAVPAKDYLSASHHGGGHGLVVPVAGRTVATAPRSHHAASLHPKPGHHSSSETRQYYQPTRQYYQWQQH